MTALQITPYRRGVSAQSKIRDTLMTLPQPLGLDVVSPRDQRFFKELGACIAELRKAQSFTQQQLAELLGMS